MAFDPVVSYAFVGVGVFTQGVALLLARRPLRMLRAGGRARGRIVGNDEEMVASTRGPGRLFHFPKVAFTTATGEPIVFRSRMGRRVAEAVDGDVDVRYDPATPHEAEVATFRDLWLFPLITSVCGLPFLVAGLLALR